MDREIPALLLAAVCLLASPSRAVADPGETDTSGDPVSETCHRIANKLFSVGYDECMDRHLVTSGGESVQGTPILYKEYPPLPDRRPLGRVLLVGGIHGDEYSSVSVVFKWMSTLDEYHSGLFHWHIVPLLNPDGLLREDSQRMNANGVDLNRNFPMPEWQDTSLKYWIVQTGRNPRRYPGSGPTSEPETRWFVSEIDRFKPDVIVSVHAPIGIVDYDGPRDGPYRLGRLYLNLIGTYPGSLGNYAGLQRRIPVVTIELPYADRMPKPGEISDIWRDLVRWLGRNIQVHQNLAGSESQDTDPS